MNGDAFEDGFAFFLELFGEFGYGHGVGEIALVQLQHVGNRVEIQVVLFQVFLQVFHGLEVGVETFFLRIGYEDDAVRAFEDELAAGFVEDLAGDGIEVEPGFEAANCSEIQGQEIEEQSAVRFGGQRHHFAFLVLAGVIVDPLEIGGLSAQTWTVVHELAVNFARRKIDERHLSLTRIRPQTYSTRSAGRPAFRLCLPPDK